MLVFFFVRNSSSFALELSVDHVLGGARGENV